MHAKVMLSSKGQVVIPKLLRTKLGLHKGSEMMLELGSDNIIKLQPLKKDIRRFFGMGKSLTGGVVMSIEDMDKAIAEEVLKNDRR